MRRYIFYVLLIILITAGCARLQVPLDNAFPYRAEFEGEAFIGGQATPISGAICLTSATAGVAQVYGPGGLAAYTIAMQDGEVKLMDMWGDLLDTFTIPLHDGIGLLAGVPPGGSYLYQRTVTQGRRIVYPWGDLLLDEGMRPREMHVSRGQALDLSFVPDIAGMGLLIQRGSDKLNLTFHTVQGGRWGHDHHNM